MMASVVLQIASLGIEVIHIPGGCTGLCQPLDVGVNKPFKARVRRMWEEWMTDLIDTTNEVRDATREEVVEWATAAFWEMATYGQGRKPTRQRSMPSDTQLTVSAVCSFILPFPAM